MASLNLALKHCSNCFYRVSLHSQYKRCQEHTTLSNSKSSLATPSVISDFKEITKMRLALSVVFSSLAGYLLGVETVDYKTLVLLALGGYFMVGASNAFNKLILLLFFEAVSTDSTLSIQSLRTLETLYKIKSNTSV